MDPIDQRTRWVAIDDTDPDISWVGEWEITRDTFENPYNRYGQTHGGSQHVTTGLAFMSYIFRGTRVIVFGTSHITNTTTGVTDPVWVCMVNNVTYAEPRGSIDEKINQWPICSVTLDDFGPHNITIGTAASEEHPFYVDLIQYRPLWEDRETLHPTVFLDSTDPGLTYDSGTWRSHGNETMLTLDRGARATVEFNGTKATWVGWMPDAYPTGASTGTWSIDGDDPVEFEIPGLPSDANGTLYYQNFFETPRLQSRGPHKLVVTHMGPSAPLTLDYLIIEDGDIHVPPGGEAKVIGGTAGGTNGRNDDPSPKKTPVGAIVGGAVGGVVFLVACALLTFFVIRRQKKKKESTMANANPPLISTSPMSTGNATSTQGPSPPPTGGMYPSQMVQYSYQPPPSLGTVQTNPSLSSVPTSNNSTVPMLYTQVTNPNASPTWSSPTNSAFSPHQPQQQSIPPYPRPQSTVIGHDSNASNYYGGSGAYPAGLQQHQQQQYRQSQVLPSPTTPSSLTPLRKSMVDARNSQWMGGGSDMSSTPDANSFLMDGSDAPSNVRVMR
ncbi:hypothetical protein CC1G_11788 [Coprinopsis cinerea okayama7|uniref:Epidermal growth factor receptor-like transmembrane-juxtamembrane segment domain-containing protein n=1 Tax=Coprinopsis cinerea (strain Okayama-7 / 130 / ATCC MYA-4618 / FGSC 9003) TaxID=240176 RepID=A8NPK5_COPC7|nr:hypothetical protein CC1G_11788 [Coprinopsis cinerea okayama7\|eukprot:XP_001835354.1 hypothetical protein CC1G_11788 [Coprinopsis cinerea okayama7\